MYTKLLCAAAALSILSVSAASAATVTAVSANATVETLARIGVVEDTDAQSAGFVGATVSDFSASALASVADNAGSLDTLGTMNATFVDAASGSLELSNFGWVSFGTVSGAANVLGSTFSYTFDLDAAAVMTLDLDVVLDARTTNAFGLQGVSLGAIGDFAGMNYANASDPSASDFIVVNLGAGTHTISMDLVGNISGSLNERIALFDGSLAWEIDAAVAAPVPLPAGFALMLGGLAAFGGLRFRKR